MNDVIRPTLARARYALRHPGVRAAIGVTLVALIALAAALAYALPIRRDHDELRARIDGARRLAVEAVRMAELARSYETGLSQVAIRESKLLADGGQAELVRRIGSLTRQRGLVLQGETYEEGRAGTAHRPLFLNLTVYGGYRGLRGFIADLAELPVWCTVEEIRIERSKDRAHQVKAHLRLVSYAAAAAPAKGRT